MKILKHLYNNLEEYISGTCLATMIGALLVQTLARAILGTAVAWAEELSRFCFIWSVFLAMALACKKVEHVCIQVQFMKCSAKTRFYIRVLRDAVWLVFNLIIVYVCIGVISESIQYPEISPTLGIPKHYVEMIIPFSFLLSSWRIIEVYLINYKAGTLDKLSI